VPLFRLGKETVGWGAPLEKPVANWDEDSITLGTAAALDCLDGLDRSRVDALFFATTTPPYMEKPGSAFISAACDLRDDIFAADYSQSLRAGTLALKTAADAIKAGTAKQALVVAADCRLGQPRSALEQVTGDGAAALLLGEDGTVAEIEASHYITDQILDVWRATGDTYLRFWEDRFMLEEGYFKLVRQVVGELLGRQGLSPKDFNKLVLYAPDARRHRELATALGFDYKTQVQDPLFGALGNTGSAYTLMMLVAALEQAKPGERILVVNYGDGADATIIQVKEGIEGVKRRGVGGYLKSKKVLPDYQTYLSWRDIYEPDPGARRPPQEGPSAAALHREKDEVLRLYGVKCKTCGTVQYPPQRVCTRCQTRDNFEKVRLSDKRATLFTYSMDYISGTKDVPLVISVINFDGGGRMVCFMTDRDVNEIKIGMPLEMSFRRLYSAEGIHNYFWKCTPVRV